MTIDEKKAAVQVMCMRRGAATGDHRCKGCPLERKTHCYAYATAKQIEENYDLVFGNKAENTPDNKTDPVCIFREITEKMADTYERKNHDYGDSFAKLRQRYPISICIRLADKLNRLDTLMSGEPAQVAESIEDTLLDIANYAVMELVERRRE